MKTKTGLTANQWQLLSAYLDNQLSRIERQKVDELLRTNPESRQALEQLHRTRVLLSCLPARHLPRSFLVTREMVPKPFLPSIMGVLCYSSAISALLLVIVLALDFLPGLQMAFNLGEQEMGESQALAMESAKAPAAEGPAIIYWGAPAPREGVYGKGGGGEGMGIGGGSADGIGGAPPAAPVVILPPDAPMDILETLPGSAEEEGLLTMEEGETDEPEKKADEGPTSREPLSGTGPILGIPPDDLQGQILNLETATGLARHAALPVSLRNLEIILAALAVITAIPVIFCLIRK